MMFWIGLLIGACVGTIFCVGFGAWWKYTHYRTPEEEARDIEEEARHWSGATKDDYCG